MAGALKVGVSCMVELSLMAAKALEWVWNGQKLHVQGAEAKGQWKGCRGLGRDRGIRCGCCIVIIASG